jgi:hypothetical protein
MHRLDVLLEIRCTRKSVVACLANELFIIVLMYFLHMRIQIGFRREYF